MLRGYHAEVDPAALGIGLEAMVAIRISKHSRELIENFRRHVNVLPEVVASYQVGGANDFLVHVAVRDAGHLRSVVLESFSARPEVVHIETSLVFEHEYRWELPNYACPAD